MRRRSSSSNNVSNDDLRLQTLTSNINSEMRGAVTPDREFVSGTAKASKKCTYILPNGHPCNRLHKIGRVGKKHNCRYCNKWYCHIHTAYTPHGKFTNCQLNSKCVCDNCYIKHPPTPGSLNKKNKASKKNKSRQMGTHFEDN